MLVDRGTRRSTTAPRHLGRRPLVRMAVRAHRHRRMTQLAALEKLTLEPQRAVLTRRQQELVVLCELGQQAPRRSRPRSLLRLRGGRDATPGPSANPTTLRSTRNISARGEAMPAQLKPTGGKHGGTGVLVTGEVAPGRWLRGPLQSARVAAADGAAVTIFWGAPKATLQASVDEVGGTAANSGERVSSWSATHRPTRTTSFASSPPRWNPPAPSTAWSPTRVAAVRLKPLAMQEVDEDFGAGDPSERHRHLPPLPSRCLT